MNTEVIATFAKVAAPAGMAIGVFLYVARDLIAKNIFPTLTKERAFHVIMTLTITAWTLALAAIAAWIYVTTRPQTPPAQPASLSEADRSRLILALTRLTYLEGEQGPVHFLLRHRCEEGATKPGTQLMLIAKMNLEDIKTLRAELQTLPSVFVLDELETFRQLQLDLAARLQILPGLAQGDSFIVKGRNTACELSAQYQVLHERLWPLARNLKVFVEKRA